MPSRSDSSRHAWTRRIQKPSNSLGIIFEWEKDTSIGMKKYMSRAVELWTEAADLGSAGACFELGVVYYGGFCVAVERDEARGFSLLEKAAILGHSSARHNLGACECDRRNWDRAVRHFLISAKMGYEDSLNSIKELFKKGLATGSQYGEALKGYQWRLKSYLASILYVGT